MSKIKPVRRLLHQFGSFLLSPRMSQDEIALALTKAGLITPVGFTGEERLTHYAETDALRSLPADLFRSTIQTALSRYIRVFAELPVRRAYVQLTEVTLLRGNEWQDKVRAGDLETSERKALGLRGHEADHLLEVLGEAQGRGIRDEFEFEVFPNVSIFHGKLWIDATTARFDEVALGRTLEGQFDHLNHEADYWSSQIDEAHDRLSDGD